MSWTKTVRQQIYEILRYNADKSDEEIRTILRVRCPYSPDKPVSKYGYRAWNRETDVMLTAFRQYKQIWLEKIDEKTKKQLANIMCGPKTS